MDTGGGDEGNGLRHLHTVEPKHKIFLSHSGAQKGFFEQVCVDLENRDRYAFFDIRWDSLPIGDHFPKLIFQAIEQCQVGVVFFSEEFFTRSKWPMLELVAMAKRLKDPAFKIMPVFFGISLEDYNNEVNRSRWSSVWRGWAECDKRIDLEEWEKTLEALRPIYALCAKDNISEIQLQKQILDAICESVPSETRLGVSYVQGKSRICKVIHEKIKAPTDVYHRHIRVVGLYGVGGTGKTTFCKVMCNEMRTKFNDKVCHVELEGENELKMLQTMLTRLTGVRNEDAQGLDIVECRYQLGNTLMKHRVFLAIDNVTDSTKVIAQAEALLQFGYANGSVVLVTARSCAQLEMVNIHENDCIEMPELEANEARSLLLYHAAPSNHVNEDDLRCCLQRCYFRKGDGSGGHFHPLALEVFGLQLGDDADQWIENLKELDSRPILSILRKSFDALNNEDQILFMDAALFYPRNFYDPEMVRAWKVSALGWLHLVHGGSVEDIKTRLKGLKKKSLLQSIDERSTGIGIHDLWREFAVMEANVGTQELSRWVYDNDEDDQNIRRREESSLRGGGWKNLQRAFIWRKSKFREEVNLSFCSNLTVLTLRNVPLVNNVLDLSALKCLKYLEVSLHGGPKSVQVLGLGSLGRLVVLRWFRMPATSPCVKEIGFLTNLQVLQLHFQGWKKTEFLDFSRLSLLRIFSLSATGGPWNMRTSWFMRTRNIRFLNREVRELQRRCHGLGDLDDFERISLNGLYMLESFPHFQKLQNLQELDISRCSFVKALPGLDELVALLELKASECRSLEELPNLQKLRRLQTLDISYCSSIAALLGLDELVALLELDARGCYNLAELPNLQKLRVLQRLDISVCTLIKALPGLDELVALLELHAGGCHSLEELPNLQKLRRLQRLDISWCSLIKALPGLDDLVALQELCAKDCLNLAELPDMRKLTSLRVLNLKVSFYEDGSTLIKAVSGLGNLIALSKVTVDFEVFEDVPDLRNLTNLSTLRLRGWSSGAASGVASLPNLKVLKIMNCEGLDEPTGISILTRLMCLELSRCDFKDVSCVSNLTALQHLCIRDCSNPKELLESLLEVTSLRFTLLLSQDSRYILDEIERLRAMRRNIQFW